MGTKLCKKNTIFKFNTVERIEVKVKARLEGNYWSYFPKMVIIALYVYIVLPSRLFQRSEFYYVRINRALTCQS